jgi:hypothetical protein
MTWTTSFEALKSRILQMEQTMKTYAGSVPRSEDGWRLLASLYVISDGGWAVYVKHQPEGKWANYRVVAQGRAYRKANYWLAQELTTGRMAEVRDFGLLRQGRPGLYKAVMQLLPVV